jgi:multidrug efflux pump subunit AcrA (membrane-fusion protein)
MASPGKPLITVYDPKGLRVIASIPQYKLAEVRRGGTARLEFPETGRWVDATRVEVLPTADARSHTVTARLYLPDDPGVAGGVIPGRAVRAHFVTGAGKRLTVTPRACRACARCASARRSATASSRCWRACRPASG